jgi:2EXR family
MSLAAIPKAHFFSLPGEIRSRIYHFAVPNEEIIHACRCTNESKVTKRWGSCCAKADLLNLNEQLPRPIAACRQMYTETTLLSLRRCQAPRKYLLGGTKCLRTFLQNMQVQKPSTVSLILRVAVPPAWLFLMNYSAFENKGICSMIEKLGIGTGQAYTTTCNNVLDLGTTAERLRLVELDIAPVLRRSQTRFAP